MSHNIVPFDFNSNTVRTTEIEGEVWFIVKDLCDILEIRNSRSSCTLLEEDEKGVVTVDTLGGKQELATVSESGMYTLVLRSRKPQAKAFRKWVTSEVLISIRKTGKYEAQEAKPKPEARQLPPVRDVLDYLEAAKSIGIDQDPILKSLFSQRIAEQLGSTATEPKETIIILTVRAAELGICQKLIGTGSQLGKYIKAIGLEPLGKSQHGKYPVNTYKLTPELDAAILDYFQGAIVAA